STTPTEPEKPITGKDYYTTANLNIRDGASTTSSKIGKIPNGTKVSVVDFNSNKTWAKVVYNNKTGWVSAQYLSTKSQEPEQKEDTYWTGTTTQNLNMRKGPSTDYSIIITIPKNSDVKIYETKSGWAKIKYKSYEGYCSASFIK
ncbi:MAG: SH3 domain-containing protein, partial [Intestinibacter bartlettii]